MTKKTKIPNKRGFVKGTWPVELRQKAYDLYMSYVPIRKIGGEIGVPDGTIREWIYQLGWNKHRNAINEQALQEFAEKRQGQLIQIGTRILDLVERTLAKAEHNGGVSLKELPKLAAMATDFDKLQRLASGQATEIKESRGISVQIPGPRGPAAIKQIIASDPFLALEETHETHDDDSTVGE